MNRQNMSFFPSSFFYLQRYAHLILFDESRPVWEALSLVDNYLKTFTYAPNLPKGPFHIENPESVFIGEGSTIGPYATIEGPCIIGKGCTIRSGAHIRKGTIIGDECVIGHNSEISRSIVLNNAKIPHLNYVGDSIVGSNVNLGAGSICANVRLDKAFVPILFEGEKIQTEFLKLGAVIGDNASVACNVVLNPGTLILPNENVLGKLRN